MSYEVSVTISAPIEVVWSVMTDVERWPDWSQSMISVQRLDDGPFQVGSRARIQQPRLPAMVWTVTHLEPLRSFTWTSTGGGVSTFAGHPLSPGPADTVTVTLSIRQTGLLAPIVGRLAAGLTRRYVNMEAQGLKRYCEAHAASPR